MPVLEKWAPFRELDPVERRFRRLFSDLGFGLTPTVTPAADIYETDDAFVIELEVPGYDEKELEIEVVDRTLTIKGERKEELEKEKKELRLRERLEASFERCFVLPFEVDSERLIATYTKGVLTLEAPKAVQMKPRKVEIAKT